MKHLVYFIKKIHFHSGIKLYLNLVAMIIISLLEGIGILLLIPMISIIGVVEWDGGVEKPFLYWLTFLERIPNMLSLPIVLCIYVLLVLFQNVLQRKITIQNAKIQHGFLRYLRLETFNSLLQANWQFYLNNRRADLINIITTEVVRASAGTYSVFQFITILTYTIIQIGLAFLIAPKITIFVLICGLVLIYLNRKFLWNSLKLGYRNFDLGKDYHAGLTDQINGIKDIKSNILEESRMDWFRLITKKMHDEQIALTKLRTKSQFHYKISSAVLIAVFIFISIHIFNAQASQLLLITVIFSRLWSKVTGIQGALEQIAATIPSLKAVRELQSECNRSKELMEEFSTKKFENLNIKKGLECQNVYFSYGQDRLQYALKNINIQIPVNKMTAIVGRSGAGKSTLIDLLMGLNKPQKGDILIDGKVLTSGDIMSLRQSISYVPQEPFLFNGSIKENLLLIDPTASEEQMWEALEFSSSAMFVRRLPEGLNTLIGDRGIRLSGGERQRLVLARAILRKPSILLLDEATSALDSENEENIQKALENIQGKMTIIVIAHRLSTIRNADQVIVMDNGSIIQKGSFGQLANEKQGVFGQLLINQIKATL